MNARYVVLSAARPRAAWFTNISQWAHSDALPIELVKCVGIDELLVRAESSRAFSAAVIDAGLSGLDRDAIARLHARSIAIVVVDDIRVQRDWRALGAESVLSSDFERADLLAALSESAPVVPNVRMAVDLEVQAATASPLRGSIIAVVGAGGSGTSTVAMSIAQAFGRWSPAPHRPTTVLADFCLQAEQAMLHDTQRVTPGLQELVDAHRGETLDPDHIQHMCFNVEGRGYDLLIGLRRRRLWNTLRPVACQQALQGLAAAYATVVLDVDEDLEGEAESGSADLEDRNVLARTAIRGADHVVAVGPASLKGLNGLCRLINDLRDFGVDESVIQPVINMAPKAPKARAGYTKALADLLDENSPAPPIFLPFDAVDEAVRAVAPLPHSVVGPFEAIVTLLRRPHEHPKQSTFERLTPGFLRRSTIGSS